MLPDDGLDPITTDNDLRGLSAVVLEAQYVFRAMEIDGAKSFASVQKRSWNAVSGRIQQVCPMDFKCLDECPSNLSIFPNTPRSCNFDTP